MQRTTRINKILTYKKFVFGYEVQSGRKTACNYLYNRHKKGLVFDNTLPHTVPVFEYNIETMLEDMNKIFPDDYIYIAGVQDEEQFALFRRFGFTMVKVNKSRPNVSRTTNGWNFLRQDMLDYVRDDGWDIIINNTGSLDDFHKELDKKI